MTCNAHFRTRMNYSSQKSCVRIWFGLVEIRGMLIFRGGQMPPIRGVTCDLLYPFSILPELFQSKSCVKILLGLVEPFKSYDGNIQKQKNFKNTNRLGGLHLTRDTHFRTRMSYSSQKSCVKFGLDWLKSEVC